MFKRAAVGSLSNFRDYTEIAAMMLPTTTKTYSAEETIDFGEGSPQN